MTSKEAFNKLQHYINGTKLSGEEYLECCKILDKDLERLEKLEKAIELMWCKNVNIVYIKIFKYFEKYSEYYTGYSSKDKLTKEEFDLLKEVLENDK